MLTPPIRRRPLDRDDRQFDGPINRRAAPSISVVIPAFNEENYLPATLDHVERSRVYLRGRDRRGVEVLVVDNASTDRTAALARSLGAIVVPEDVHNVARARNTGARAATGDLLVFIDADTLIPEALLFRIVEVMADPACAGGAVDTDYRPARSAIAVYLQMWRWLGRIGRMAQGAAQFCRREAFLGVGGYDEGLYIGEDVDFVWRLRGQGRVSLIEDLRVVPSCRRFDRWPLWRTLLWTNPVVALLARRHRRFWDGWYGRPPR